MQLEFAGKIIKLNDGFSSGAMAAMGPTFLAAHGMLPE
jgi:hypothetical protein